jgi:hypothetical protein
MRKFNQKLGYKLGSLALFTILLVSSITIVNAAARTEFTVCNAGCDYDSVKRAIERVPANSKIMLKAGDYTVNNPIEFSKNNIVLEGESKETTKIRFKANATTGFIINADEAWITNITLYQSSVAAQSLISMKERPDGSRPTMFRFYNANAILEPVNDRTNNQFTRTDIAAFYGKGANAIRMRNTVIDGFDYGIKLDSPEFAASNHGPFLEDVTIQNASKTGFESNINHTNGLKYNSGIRIEKNTKFLNNNIAINLNACSNEQCETPIKFLTFGGATSRAINLNDTTFAGNTVDIKNSQLENLDARNAIFELTDTTTRIESYNLLEQRLQHGCQNSTGNQALITCNNEDLATLGNILLTVNLESSNSTILENSEFVKTNCGVDCATVNAEVETTNTQENQTTEYSVFNSADESIIDWTATNTETEISFDFTDQPEDTYYIKTRVLDSNSNPISYSETRSSNDFIVDNTAPLQDITLGGGSLNGETLEVARLDGVSYQITYTELVSAVVDGTLTLYSADASFNKNASICTKQTYIFTETEESTVDCSEVELSPEGNYIAEFTAIDTAGNESVVQKNITVIYVLEQTAPSTEVFEPTNGQEVSTKLITVDGFSTDDLSGVKQIDIYLAPALVAVPIQPEFEAQSSEEEPTVILTEEVPTETNSETDETEQEASEPIAEETTDGVEATEEVETETNSETDATETAEEPEQETSEKVVEESTDETDATEEARVLTASTSRETFEGDENLCGAFQLETTVNNNKTSDLTNLEWQTSFEPTNGPGVYCMKVVTRDFAQSENTEDIVINNINYTYEKSSNTELSALNLNEELISNFTSTQTEYLVELLNGTTAFPIVTAESVDENAEVEITAPEEFPGVFTILVTAEDGSTQEYTLTFTVAELPPVVNQGTTSSGSRAINQDVLLQSEEQVTLCTAFTDIENRWSETYIKNLFDLGVVCGNGMGLFNPETNITREELAKIAVELFDYEITTTSANFTDISNRWSENYINTLSSLNILTGFEDGTFKPEQSITRAEALKVLLLAKKSTITASSSTFTDVNESDWFYSYVTFAAANNVIEGYEDGTFKPEQSITREELAKIAILIYNL